MKVDPSRRQAGPLSPFLLVMLFSLFVPDTQNLTNFPPFLFFRPASEVEYVVVEEGQGVCVCRGKKAEAERPFFQEPSLSVLLTQHHGPWCRI